MNRIFNIGINGNLSSSLRDKVRLTNQIAIVVFFMTSIFLVSTIGFTVLNLISCCGVLSSLGVLLLNYWEKHQASRILLCLSPSIILSLTQACVVQFGEPLIIGATISLIITVIPPFLLFGLKEKSLLLPIVAIIWCLFLFQNTINQWIQISMDSSFFYSPYMTISSNLVNLLLITFFLFFFLRQKVETEREKEDEIKLLLESSENMITLHDKSGKYLYYNGPKCYNIKSDDIVGKMPHDFFEKNAADTILHNINEAFSTGKSAFIENQLDWQGGKKWFSEYIYPVFDKESKIKYVAKVCIDINEQKIAKQKLKESKKRLSLIYNNTQEMMTLIKVEKDKQFIIESFNNAATNWIKQFQPTIGFEEILGFNIQRFYEKMYAHSQEFFKKRLEMFENLVENKESIVYGDFVDIKTKSGNKKAFLESTFTPILDEQKQCTYILSVGRDITDRLKAEETLKQNEERLSLIFNSTESEIGLLKVTEDNRFVVESMNKPALERMVLYGILKPDEHVLGLDARFIYKNIFKYSDKKTQDKIGNFQKIISTKKPIQYEYTSEIKGQKEYFSTTLSPIINKSGNCSQILFVTENITQRIEANQALLDNQKRLSLIFNNTLSNMLLIRYEEERGFIIEAFNDTLWKTLKTRGFKLKKEGIVEKNLEDFYKKAFNYKAEMIQERIDMFSEVVQTKKTITYEAVVNAHHESSIQYYFENTVSPISNKDGNVTHILYTTRNVSERKKNELIIKQSQIEIQRQLEQKRLILETTLNGYILVDKETNIIDVNPAYCNLSGYSKEEILTMNVNDLEGHKNPAGVEERAKQMMIKGSERFESIHYTKEGKELILDTNLSLIQQDNQLMIAGFMRDITAQKKVQKELEYRLQLETLLTRLSNQFINVSVENIDNEVVKALKQLCQFAQFDRSFVVLFTSDKKYKSNEYEWCEKGVNPIKQTFQKVPLDSFPYLHRKMINKENILIKNIEELPKEAMGLRKTMKQFSIKSLIHVPLTWKGSTIGFIGFDSLKGVKEWPRDLIVLLRFSGEMITNVLQRKKAELTLKNSEQQLSTIYNNSLDNISLIQVASNGKYILKAINKPAVSLLKKSSNVSQVDVTGKEVKDLFKNFFKMSDKEIEERYTLMDKVIKGKKTVTANSYILIPDTDEKLVYENILSPILENGKCVNILYVSKNITEREKAKDALLESEKRMSSVFNSTKDQMAIFNIEKDGRLVLEEVNNSFKSGWAKAKIPFELDQIIGEDIYFYCKNIFAKEESELERRMQLVDKIKVSKKGYHTEEEYTDLNGRKYFIDLTISPILDDDGQSSKILFVIRDITFRKQANERLISKILEAEDRERKRIAKELHDSLGQNLTTASLNLNYLNNVVNSVDQDYNVKFHRGMKFLNNAIDESRNIAHNLMPQSIVDFGFVLTVESMLEGLQNTIPAEFVFYNNLNGERLPSYQELSLFRITQEAINNIIKHAEASKVTIQLMKYEDVILLTIEDDGKGFDLEKTKNRSFGLNNMTTRISSLSGSIAIDSSPGNGTFITAEIPV